MATFSTIYSSNIFSSNIWGASWLFLFCCFYRFAVFCSVLPQPINLTFSWWGLEFFSMPLRISLHIDHFECVQMHAEDKSLEGTAESRGRCVFHFDGCPHLPWIMLCTILNSHQQRMKCQLPEEKTWHLLTSNGNSLPTQCRMQVGGGEDHGGFCRQERLSVGTCEAGRSKSCLIKLSKLVDAWFGGGYKKEKESFHRGGARAPRKKTAAAVNLLGWFPVGCSPKEGRFQLQLQTGDGTYHNKS